MADTITKDFTLSIIIPVFNERDTIEEILVTVLATPYKKEVLVVDDGSSDGTRELLSSFTHPEVRVIMHEQNSGKGSALRTGFANATGDIILIQDADLEYDPGEYHILLQPILTGRADVVYGSRFAGYGAHRVLYFWHSIGNRFLTLLSNLFTDINLSDMETCYKVFTKEAIKGITIEENRFGFEPEITAKIAKKNLRIYEVPVSYYGRTYEQGKKINWKDGIRAVICILKYNIFR
ncbi:MAG: glycosyltransferase family 2 protein [Proteobacteria bacterium]|nr:glycosyltransferase family 2 protein [Pseudomonadota bacterium]MBU1709827.1 glycosyltransferase family 2 protein [Pseudomonadota bacterium]